MCAGIKSPNGYGGSFTGELMQHGLLVDLVLLVVGTTEPITAIAPDLLHLPHPSHPKTKELANRRGAMPQGEKGRPDQ